MQSSTLNLVEITLLLCELKSNSDQSDTLTIINKIEEALASETQRNESLKKELKGLKDSHERLKVKQDELQKKKDEVF